MQTYLEDINARLGVIGSFICLSDGTIAAQAVPGQYDSASVKLAARVAAQTLQALDTSGVRASEVDLAFGDGRLILKNLRNGILAILCARNINLALLNLAANAVTKKIETDLKPTKVMPSAPAAAKPTKTTSVAPPAAMPVEPAGAPVPMEATPQPLMAELEQEASRLVQEGNRELLHLRAMGEVAMWLACPNHRALLTPPETRKIELAALSAETNAIQALFQQNGFENNTWANNFYGNRRMTFGDSTRELTVELFFDVFEMYHRFDLTRFLPQTDLPLAVTPLMLTRLQIVHTDPKVLSELCALMLEYDLGGTEKGKLDATFIAPLCSEDWGWYKTVTLNLEKVKTFAGSNLTSSDAALVAERVQRLRQSIDQAPKGLVWQTRARLGETVKWYDTPPVTSIRRPSWLGKKVEG